MTAIKLCSNSGWDIQTAKFAIGQVVKHRKFPFRGIIYDVDPVFANTEAWWQAIPEFKHRKFPFRGIIYDVDPVFANTEAGNSRRGPAAQGSAFLSPLRRKRGNRICRRCLGAKPHSRYLRQSNSPSARRRNVRARTGRRLQDQDGTPKLNIPCPLPAEPLLLSAEAPPRVIRGHPRDAVINRPLLRLAPSREVIHRRHGEYPP